MKETIQQRNLQGKIKGLKYNLANFNLETMLNIENQIKTLTSKMKEMIRQQMERMKRRFITQTIDKFTFKIEELEEKMLKFTQSQSENRYEIKERESINQSMNEKLNQLQLSTKENQLYSSENLTQLSFSSIQMESDESIIDSSFYNELQNKVKHQSSNSRIRKAGSIRSLSEYHLISNAQKIIEKPCRLIAQPQQFEISHILSREQIPEFPIKVTFADKAIKFCFKPLNTVYLKNFSYENKTVELTKEVKNMVQFVSESSIPQIGKHVVGVKILNAPEQSIYVGLIKQRRKELEHSAKTCDDSIISYKIVGGKQLFVLNKNQQAYPVFQQQWLFILVDYQDDRIDWYINDKLSTSTRVNLKGPDQQKWHAFVTMKFKGNKVQLMQ